MHLFGTKKTYFKTHKFFLFFSLAYFIFSFLTYKDYGVTFDEKVEYEAGSFLLTYYANSTNEAYVNELVNNRPNFIEARQLPIFSVYSRIYPAVLNLLNPNHYFEQYHLGNLLFGYFLFLFSYIIFYLHYKDGKKAFVAPLFILLTSLLFGHIPANPKDIPFATLFLLGILVTYFFQIKKSNKNFEILVVGLVFGLVLSQRTVGFTLFIPYVLFKFYDKKKITKETVFDVLLQTILIFFVALVAWIVSLPFLGANLPANFIAMLKNAASYSNWDHEIIYFGEYLFKQQRPWHYLFVYLLFKLPLFVLGSLLVGIVFVIRKRLKYDVNHPIFIFALLFVINSALYLVIHPVVYNGIRHFLYLVVLVVLASAFLFLDSYELLNKRLKFPFVVIFATYMLFTAGRMLHLHPYEYIYYNELIGGLHGAEGNFDVEYWGASYKEAAEYVRLLVEDLKLENIKVYSCDNQFAVVYYSQFKYKLLDRSKTADIVICDLHKDVSRGYYDATHPIVKTINRESVPIFNIRASHKFISQYGDELSSSQGNISLPK